MSMIDDRLAGPNQGDEVLQTKSAAAKIWNIPTALLVHLFKGLIIWQRRCETRDRLAALDDRLLKDIGMPRDVRDREVAKPLWRR